MCLRPSRDGWTIFNTGTWFVLLAKMEEHVAGLPAGRGEMSYIKIIFHPLHGSVLDVLFCFPHKKLLVGTIILSEHAVMR